MQKTARPSFLPVIKAAVARVPVRSLVAFIVLCGCMKRETVPAATSDPSAAALRAVSTKVSANNVDFTLQAEAWRSFQPITTPDGDPLIVVLRLTSSAPIDSTLQIDTVWIARGSEVWAGQPREEQRRSAGATVMEVVVRQGPNWSPGDSIDVVAQLRVLNARPVALRAPQTHVARVD